MEVKWRCLAIINSFMSLCRGAVLQAWYSCSGAFSYGLQETQDIGFEDTLLCTITPPNILPFTISALLEFQSGVGELPECGRFGAFPRVSLSEVTSLHL